MLSRGTRAIPTPARANASCELVVDRHVPKNAGTTVRSMLMLNALKLKRCRFVGYDVSSTWRSVHRAGAAFNHVALGDLLRKLRPGTRWCVEAHIVADCFWRDLASLRTLRPRCRALVMVRVRQPLAWYQSYYSWTVLGKQRGREEGYGANFSEWLAGAPNLQSRPALIQTLTLARARARTRARTRSRALAVPTLAVPLF